MVQVDFSIDGTLGMGEVNTYALFHAAPSPAIGKLAGRYASRRAFAVCVVLLKLAAHVIMFFYRK